MRSCMLSKMKACAYGLFFVTATLLCVEGLVNHTYSKDYNTDEVGSAGKANDRQTKTSWSRCPTESISRDILFCAMLADSDIIDVVDHLETTADYYKAVCKKQHILKKCLEVTGRKYENCNTEDMISFIYYMCVRKEEDFEMFFDCLDDSLEELPTLVWLTTPLKEAFSEALYFLKYVYVANLNNTSISTKIDNVLCLLQEYMEETVSPILQNFCGPAADITDTFLQDMWTFFNKEVDCNIIHLTTKEEFSIEHKNSKIESGSILHDAIETIKPLGALFGECSLLNLFVDVAHCTLEASGTVIADLETSLDTWMEETTKTSMDTCYSFSDTFANCKKAQTRKCKSEQDIPFANWLQNMCKVLAEQMNCEHVHEFPEPDLLGKCGITQSSLNSHVKYLLEQEDPLNSMLKITKVFVCYKDAYLSLTDEYDAICGPGYSRALSEFFNDTGTLLKSFMKALKDLSMFL